MKITTIGKGTIGATLGRLWTRAGHDVTLLGRDGGDASDADVVLLAAPSAAAVEALHSVAGLDGKTVLDATNRLNGETPPAGHASVAEYVAATTRGPVAKAFSLNFGGLFEQAAAEPTRPHNIWVGDEAARAVVEQLSADIGMVAINAGPLTLAGTQEAFARMLVGIVRDADKGLLFYRFDPPSNR